METKETNKNKVTSISENKNFTLSVKENLSIQKPEETDDDKVHLLDYYEENNFARCLRFIKSLTIEPAIFFYMFSFTIRLSCMSNLMMDKACRNNFNYSDEICNNISAFPDEKKNLEIIANDYNLYSNLMSFISAGAMVFIAPWSDKYGRKLPLVLSCLGAIACDIAVVLCVLYFESSLTLLIMTRLPHDIFGGFICFLTIVYSHAAEVTTEKDRTLKYTTIEIAFMIGMPLGGLAGGFVFKYFGYFYVFVTATICHILSAIWVMIFFEETLGKEATSSWKTKRRNFFRLDSVSRSFVATVKRREDKGRTKMMLYFISMGAIILTYEITIGLGYVYAHHIYNWKPTKYNSVNTTFSLSIFVLMGFMAPLFLKVLKISDPMLGILGTLSMIAKFTLLAFAKYKVAIYYLGNAAGFLSGFSSLAVRAEISKIVSKEELVLVFSFLATCEALFPMVGSAVSTKIFNATIDVYPSVAFLTAAGFLFIPLITFIWAYIRSRRR